MLHMLNQLLAQASNGGTGFAMAGGAAMLVLIAIAILASIFWLWMLIDCLGGSMPTGEKLVWFLVIFFLHLLGALKGYSPNHSSRSLNCNRSPENETSDIASK
jgi:hypothetical protein